MASLNNGHSDLSGAMLVSCITQRNAQGPARTCYESKKEDRKVERERFLVPGLALDRMQSPLTKSEVACVHIYTVASLRLGLTTRGSR